PDAPPRGAGRRPAEGPRAPRRRADEAPAPPLPARLLPLQRGAPPLRALRRRGVARPRPRAPRAARRARLRRLDAARARPRPQPGDPVPCRAVRPPDRGAGRVPGALRLRPGPADPLRLDVLR